jgi:hypothetical protein
VYQADSPPGRPEGGTSGCLNSAISLGMIGIAVSFIIGCQNGSFPKKGTKSLHSDTSGYPLRCKSDLGALLQVVAAIDAFNELTDYDDLPDSHKEKVCARGRTALYAVANRLQGIVGSQADNAAFEFYGLKSST